jgi:hypothetical protein
MQLSHTLPNILSNKCPANTSVPGLCVHQATLFPLLESLLRYHVRNEPSHKLCTRTTYHPPASPITSSSKPPFPSVTGLPLRSATIQPLVHCPLVSTLKSSILNVHFSSAAQLAYHTVNGSCSCSPIFSRSCCGLSERLFSNVALRKSVAHSASGLPAMGGEVVYDLKSLAGSRWRSVMSGGICEYG